MWSTKTSFNDLNGLIGKICATVAFPRYHLQLLQLLGLSSSENCFITENYYPGLQLL